MLDTSINRTIWAHGSGEQHPANRQASSAGSAGLPGDSNTAQTPSPIKDLASDWASNPEGEGLPIPFAEASVVRDEPSLSNGVSNGAVVCRRCGAENEAGENHCACCRSFLRR